MWNDAGSSSAYPCYILNLKINSKNKILSVSYSYKPLTEAPHKPITHGHK